jgi:hypothetical protein
MRSTVVVTLKSLTNDSLRNLTFARTCRDLSRPLLLRDAGLVWLAQNKLGVT